MTMQDGLIPRCGAGEDTAAGQPDSGDPLPDALSASRAYLIVAVLLIGKVLLTRYLALGDANPLTGIAIESAFVLAYLGLADLLFYRHRFAAYVAADALMSVFLLALVVYAAYFDRVLSLGTLRLVGQVEAVRGSVIALLEPVHLWYVVDVPVLVVLGMRSRGRIAQQGQSASRGIKTTGAAAAIAALVLSALAVTPAANGDSLRVARSRGTFAYETGAAIADLVDDRSPEEYVSVVVRTERDGKTIRIGSAGVDPANPAAVQEAIDRVMLPQISRRSADFARGAYAGANVIAIQVEALQSFALGISVDGQIVMPWLGQMIGESWYFPNGFTQSGIGTTSDAEFSMNTSLYPPANDAASVAYVDRKIPSLPRLLDGIGYDTFTMHANTVRYWNRKELYPALGFSRYYDRSFFATDSVIGMGTSDSAMFKMAWPEIRKAARKGPFYAQIVTLTPHHPFNLPEQDVGIQLPGWLHGSIPGNYLEAMNYEDRQLGWFIQELKTSGLWDTSIVVIYGDHGGLRAKDLADGSNEPLFELLLEHPYTAADRVNVPIIIHLPGQVRGLAVAQPAGQVDILPTLADALGLDPSSTPVFGRNLFESSRTLLVGRSGLPAQSFINDRVVCMAGEGFDDSKGVSCDTWLATEILPEDEQDFDDALAMSRLCADYVRHLPKRPSQGVLDAIIPVRKQ